ncbi:unnamed protein product [Thlaspi arvense]|uniref:RRM domain-containing protein n=1 Tax=Thlaspi arvense TaxID=13288 RepID=A0AAU9SN13_THLAR|nr:unnamed protein product [Thlaspi arvense]
MGHLVCSYGLSVYMKYSPSIFLYMYLMVVLGFLIYGLVIYVRQSQLPNFSMVGSAIKGLKLNDSGDADIRKSSRMMSRIYVEGYDTSLPPYDFVMSMGKFFASCGDVIHVYIPGNVVSVTPIILNRFALVYLRGGGAEVKALKLNGSYMGEHKLVVEAYPFHANHLDSELSPMRDADNRRRYVMGVRGYDTSLALDYVKDMLTKHVSICGRIPWVSVGQSMAYVTLDGQDTVDKALQLGGCDGEGMENSEVSLVAPPERCPMSTTMPSWFYEFSSSSEKAPPASRVASRVCLPWKFLVDYWNQIRAPPEPSAEEWVRAIQESPTTRLIVELFY